MTYAYTLPALTTMAFTAAVLPTQRSQIAPSELVSVLGYESPLADPEFWNRTGVQLTNPLIGEEIRRRLAGIIRNLERNTVAASTQAVDFLRCSIIEAFVTSFINAQPPDRAPRFYAGSRLVREVDN